MNEYSLPNIFLYTVFEVFVLLAVYLFIFSEFMLIFIVAASVQSNLGLNCLFVYRQNGATQPRNLIIKITLLLVV